MKELKEVVQFGLSLHLAYEKATEDGKLDFLDLGYAIDPISKLLPAVENVSAVKDELKSMDEASRAAFMAEIKAEYDIADDVLEAKVEGAVELALHMAQYLGVIGAYKRA